MPPRPDRAFAGAPRPLALTPVGRIRLHARALAYVVAARVLLRRHDTTATLRRLVRSASPRGARDSGQAMTAVQRAGRIAHASCLPQSVALVALLARQGTEPRLVLGCRRYDDQEWGAHAWVEIDGLVLDVVPSGTHQELAVLDRVRNWEPAQRA